MQLSTLSVFGLAAAAAVAIAAPASADHLDNPNLLVDPSFETVLTFDGPPFVGTWEGFSGGDGATAEFTIDMPRTGAQSLELNIENVANNFAGAFQDVFFGPGLDGTMAWYSGYHMLVGDAGGSEYRIEWRNSVAGTEVSRTQLAASPAGTGYEEFIIADMIPAGADSARIVYAIQSFGGALNQQVYVDDLNFNIEGVTIPEPGTLAMFGLGGGLMLLRRRKA